MRLMGQDEAPQISIPGWRNRQTQRTLRCRERAHFGHKILLRFSYGGNGSVVAISTGRFSTNSASPLRDSQGRRLKLVVHLLFCAFFGREISDAFNRDGIILEPLLERPNRLMRENATSMSRTLYATLLRALYCFSQIRTVSEICLPSGLKARLVSFIVLPSCERATVPVPVSFPLVLSVHSIV
jgi:hypothetical protein